MSTGNNFKVFGPFKMKYLKNTKTLDASATERAIKSQIKCQYPKDNLDSKGGCYVFAIRRSGGGASGGSFMPWYVGKAVKSSLLKESLDCEKYKKCYFKVAATEHGTPVLFWIAKAAPGKKNSLNKGTVGTMERKLIAAAALRNQGLMTSTTTSLCRLRSLAFHWTRRPILAPRRVLRLGCGACFGRTDNNWRLRRNGQHAFNIP